MAYEFNGHNVSYDYSELIEELQSDLEEELLNDYSIISIVRDKDTIAPDINYHPIIDYYYPVDFKDNDWESLYNRDEFTDEEWEDLKERHEKIYQQYKEDEPYLEKSSVLAVLTEMKQWNKIL
jgi:hypothetical protein